MGQLKDTVSKQIIDAMKAKDKIRLNALRFLRIPATLTLRRKKAFIENDTSTKGAQDEQDIVISHAKKIKESITMYPEGSLQRADIEAYLTK